MRVFVIGGAGFIGRRVVSTFAARGCDVTSLDLATTDVFERAGLKVRSLQLDVSSFEDVIAAMLAHRPEVVVNLGYLRETVPHPAMRVNVLGMDNVFEAARLADVGHVVYSSSIAVNGRHDHYGDRAITEDDPVFPTYQYAVRDKSGKVVTGKIDADSPAQVASKLKTMGYDKAQSLNGGLTAWREANLPVEKSA